MDNNKPTDDSVVERVLHKLIETDEEFRESFLDAADSILRLGLRPTDEDTLEGFECSAEYHFSNMTGEGVSVVPLLYSLSFRIAGEGGYVLRLSSKNGEVPRREV